MKKRILCAVLCSSIAVAGPVMAKGKHHVVVGTYKGESVTFLTDKYSLNDYCPGTITFAAANKAVPNSNGKMTGSNGNNNFKSVGMVAQPTSGEGTVYSVVPFAIGSIGGTNNGKRNCDTETCLYGYVAGKVTTCYYKYDSVHSENQPLTMTTNVHFAKNNQSQLKSEFKKQVKKQIANAKSSGQTGGGSGA